MRTYRHLTPIEMAIDRATGMTASALVPIYVEMKCPRCRRKVSLRAEEWMPDSTKTIEVLCPKCRTDDAEAEASVRVLDAAGDLLAE